MSSDPEGSQPQIVEASLFKVVRKPRFSIGACKTGRWTFRASHPPSAS